MDFRLNMTQVMAKEHGFTIDLDSFEKELALQRQRSKTTASFSGTGTTDYPASEFVGYNDNFVTESDVRFLQPYLGGERHHQEIVC